jgi:ribosomal protein S18 acetylase RimI-like enzyme
MKARFAEMSEAHALAELWYAGWQDAHAQIVPAALAKVRTLESFEERLIAGLPSVRTIGAVGAPAGLCWVKADELYQLYVARESRGLGIATLLIEDAEARLRAAGVDVAWLACAIGNERAARFYERSGWLRVGNMINRLETPNGLIELEVWRHEKRLVPA